MSTGGCEQQGAGQSAQKRRLISTFVIYFLERIISKLTTSEISIFELVSEAEETGLSVTLSEIPKTGFLTSRPISREVWFVHEATLDIPVKVTFLDVIIQRF